MAYQLQKPTPLAVWLMAIVFGLASTAAYADTCDADANGTVDFRDIFAIQVLSNGQLASGANDPKDADGNGIINNNDVRICIGRCTPLGCPGLENRRPRASNDSAATTVNQPVTIDLVANDRDVDGRLALSKLRIVAKPRRGRVINHRNGTVTYRPNRGFLGSDVFRYEIQDNQGEVSNVARVRVSIRNSLPPSGNNPISPNNLPPVANAGADINAPTNNPVTLDGSQSSDPERGQLSFSWQFLTVPAGSTATIANSQSPTPNFTPNVDGVYELVLTVSDGVNASTDNVLVTATTANVSPNITINTPNPQPALVGFDITPDISFTVTDNDGPKTLAVSWSFVQPLPAGSALTNASIANPPPPPNSNLAIASFTPDVVGAYTVRLTAFDGSATSTADVVINADINTPPIANAGADFAVPFPLPALPPGNTVVLNGSGIDQVVGPDVPLHFTWSFVTVPTPGSTLTNNDIKGRLTASPSFIPDRLGEYILSLEVNDGDPAFTPNPTLDNVVVKANAAPVALNDSYTVTSDTTLNEPTASGLLANDTDGNGDDLIVVRDPSDTGPTNGTLTMTQPDLENGSFSYVPNPGFEGTDSFTYRVNDRSNILPPYVPNTISAPATVTITVEPPNSPPVLTASGATPSFTENGPPVVAVTVDGGITVTDPDVSDTNLESATVTISNPQDGAAEVLAATACAGLTVTQGLNSLNITGSQPIATYQTCLRSVTYSNSSQNPNTTTRIIAFTANDGTATSNPALVSLTVNAVNDRPSFTAANPPAVNEDAGAQIVPGWVTNFDPGHPDESTQAVDSYAVSAVGTPTLFAVPPTVDASGTLSYTPAPNMSGTSTFQVTVRDNGGTANGGIDTSVAQIFTITVNAVNDAPSFTAIDPPAINEDAGAQTVNAWASFNPGNVLESAQAVSQYIVSNVSNAGLFSAGPSVNASGALSYTPAANANGTSTFQVAVQDNGGTANGGVNTSGVQTFTITVNAVNDPPVAQDKPASAATNIHTHMKRTGVDAGLLTGVTDVDSGVNGCTPSFSVASVSVAAGSLGTVSNLNAFTGTFDFEPAANSTAPVTLNYTVQDSGCPGPAATSAIKTIALTITGPKIWFVNAAASPLGNGTLSQPFQTLASVGAVDAVDDGIFVSSGTYNEGFTMLSGQQLIGQGAVGASFDSLFGISPPSGTIARPTVAGTRPVLQNTVTLASNSVAKSTTVKGLNISTTNNIALTDPAGATTDVSVTEVDVTATTATAVSFNDLTGTVTLGNTTSGGGTNNVNLTNVGATINLGNGALSGSTGTAFNVSAGTGTITYGGTITKANNAQRPVSVANKTGGSVTFTGGITANTGPTLPLGISLTNNTGSTVNFQGGVVLSTGANPAFAATGGGTVNVTGTTNTLTTTTGTALNVANTTIGASGLTFQSISANGAASGIVLNTTGTSGGLTITGTGTANSGGTIQNSTGTGIALTSTQSTNLSRMTIQNSGDDGINGASVNGFALSNVTVTNNGNSVTDEGIELTNPSGAMSFSNVTATLNAHNHIFIDDANNTGGNSTLTMTGTLIGGHRLPAADPSNTSNNGMLMTIRGTAVLGTSSISGSTFRNNRALGLQVTGGDTANVSDLTVSGNTFEDTGTGNSQEISVDFAKAQTSSMTVKMLNNTTILNHNSQAMNFFTGADVVNPPAGNYNARIDGNVIGSSALIDSGSKIGNGMRLNVNGGTSARILANNNTLHQIPNGRGIESIARNGTGGAHFTVTNNIVNAPTATTLNVCGPAATMCPLAPIHVQSNAVTVANTVCSAVTGNTAYDPTTVAGGLGAESSVQLQESNASTHNYEGNTALTALANLNNTNPAAVTRSAPAAVSVVAVGTCLTPP